MKNYPACKELRANLGLLFVFRKFSNVSYRFYCSLEPLTIYSLIMPFDAFEISCI